MRRLAFAVCLTCLFSVARAEDWPALPAADGAVEIPAQEWPLKPGPRRVRVKVSYPGGQLSKVGPQTGVMLTLHNWGGTDCVGTASPETLAREFDVVALCVNYLQSGRESIDGPEPYDFGYLQALDALRALWWMRDGLNRRGQLFASGRLYTTGGSGGGNVSLMANKLAPRTFACVIDLCGMPLLSDDVAFHRPGGSDLNARYVRQPGHPFHLTRDAQELRFVAFPDHLTTMKALGTSSRVIVVHGADDKTCLTSDARQMVALFEKAGLTVEPRFITAADVDGKVFTTTGHALGNRTLIVPHVAGKYLRPDSPDLLAVKGLTDFDRKEDVRYRTANGTWVISYAAGYPVGRFEPVAPPPRYPDHVDLTYVLNADGTRRPVMTAADWNERRQHVLAGLQQAMGPLPGELSRVPLNVKTVETKTEGDLVLTKLSYQSDSDDRVSAWLIKPAKAEGKLPAVLCLQQTTSLGKDEPAGFGGNPDLHYARHLALRGYVTLAPDYPSFGEHPYDFSPEHGYESGSMKAIWDNVRAVDLLQSLEEVDGERIGVIGHSLGGHSAIFTAALEPRLKVIVSSCGFTRFGKDDLPSWTGPRYVPKIASEFKNDAALVPFDFPELLGSLAPRPFFASAAKQDDDFDVTGVEESIVAAKKIYALLETPNQIEAYYPDAPHSFPADARERAYAFLDRYLKSPAK